VTQIPCPKREKIPQNGNYSFPYTKVADGKLTWSQFDVRKILATANATATTYIATCNYRDKTTKINLPNYLFSTGKSYLRNRKVLENSGNDSRYNRCNIHRNTMLTKTLPIDLTVR